MKKFLVALLLLASPVQAQQQTPAETALQINRVIGEWGQQLMQQERTIQMLQKQIVELQKAQQKVQEKKTDD